MKTEKEIKDHLLQKKHVKPIYKALMWVLGDSVDEEFKKKVAQKQKAAKGKSKGSGFENAVAKRLSLWWTDGEDEKCIRRVPLSGGYDKTSISGDVFCPSNPVEFPFSVECKNQMGWNMFQVIEGKGAPISWWVQTVKDEEAGRYKREPMLIFTANQRPVFCMMKLETVVKLEMNVPKGTTRNYWYTLISADPYKELVGGPVVLMYFEDLLKHFTPEMVKGIPVEKR